jgi:hypothetical protein
MPFLFQPSWTLSNLPIFTLAELTLVQCARQICDHLQALVALQTLSIKAVHVHTLVDFTLHMIYLYNSFTYI